MKYDDNHKRDFEGAVGKCFTCGLIVTLDWGDKPYRIHSGDSYWIVKCPHCGADIECQHETEEVKS